MSIITKSIILKMVRSGELEIDPFDKDQVGAGSVDLHLGNEFRIFSKSKGVVDIGASPDYSKVSRQVSVKSDGSITIKPGQFLNGITLERIKLPKGFSGRIEGRSRFARIGLLVHVSSGFVQPGTDGKIVLEIVNLSPFSLRLRPGIPVCQLVIEEAKGGSTYKGRYYGQNKP